MKRNKQKYNNKRNKQKYNKIMDWKIQKYRINRNKKYNQKYKKKTN